MFRVSLANPNLKRTIQPKYAGTQATPYAGYLDPAWTRTVDILPGMVMYKTGNGETFSLCSASTHKPFGLSALFLAPNGSSIGGPVDEVTGTANGFGVWTGGKDATFEILSPAFDTSADYTLPTDGSRKMLSFTLAAHAQGPGKLTVSGGTNAASNPVAELLDATPSRLLVRLNEIA